jgi:hypothetical protein
MRRRWWLIFSLLGLLFISILLVGKKEVVAMDVTVAFANVTNTPPFGAAVFQVRNSSPVPVRLFHCTVAGIASAMEPLDVSSRAGSEVTIRLPVPTTLPATVEFHFQRHYTSREKFWRFFQQKAEGIGLQFPKSLWPIGESQIIFCDIVGTNASINHAIER